uniref:Uncharacterized protein n=1 Tax=Oryza punctata TaxID=4537 RepID=A0A0E0MNR5_ORYPU
MDCAEWMINEQEDHTVPSWQGSEGGKYSCNHTAEGGNHACGGCNACVLRRSMPTSCGLKSSK